MSEVAESLLDFLHASMVKQFADQDEKLELIGYRVGFQLVERYTKEKPRLVETLDIIKFLCKDFWNEIFRKQIDNLRTNYRGTFVLQDTKFRYLTRLSTAGQPKSIAIPYLMLTSGIIRGALSNLGIACTVTPEILQLPTCTFTIKLVNK
eukprot:c21044_g1_i1.p1 GENE.c21044_g1_i1~~c21044_g1_i1.p1  ORF type:complete len:166 (-),score=47.78 c21044_g1_i1:146-595(-)